MSYNIPINVTTEPMAREISRVSTSVAGTTAAVVTMQAAVIGAEQQAAKKICQNVNRGFHALIHSQISQKIAKTQSEVDSHLMALAALSKQLLAIKDRMTHDYAMISARYHKLFVLLNQNLKNRIFEIDKAVTNFSVREVGIIANRPLNLTAVPPLMQLESLTESQKIISAHVKKRSGRVLESVKNFLLASKRQKEMSAKILARTPAAPEAAQISVPVIVCESVTEALENKNVRISAAQEFLDGYAKSEIKNSVYSNLQNINWLDGKVSDAVAEEFSTLNTGSSNSERVKTLTMELFRRSSIQISAGMA